MGTFTRTKNSTLRNDRFRTPIQRQQTTDDLNKLYTLLGTNISGIRRDVRAREDRYQQVEKEVKELKQQNEELKLQNQRIGDTMERLENAMMQLLDTLQSQSHKSSRNTSVQPKASQSAPPEVKAGDSKEPRRWSTEKPDPPKREKSKPPKGKGVARGDPDDSDSSSSSDSSGGPPKKKKDRHSLPNSSPSSSCSSSDSSSESGLGLKNRRKDSKKSSDGDDSKLRWKRFDFTLDKENHLAGWANWELWSNALSPAMEEIGYEDGMKLGQSDQLRLAKAITKTCKRANHVSSHSDQMQGTGANCVLMLN
ncbi:hypothetical protein DL765_009760 [Monosporascus sp. GIB2]|nr:hypothetical protein DL765_009760 [Monosporascus sp. GIB2]